VNLAFIFGALKIFMSFRFLGVFDIHDAKFRCFLRERFTAFETVVNNTTKSDDVVIGKNGNRTAKTDK
jgi:hypothetical protein